MKQIFCYILLINILITTSLSAEPPGGGRDGYRQFFACFQVNTSSGSPVANVEVELYVRIFGTEGNGQDVVNGYTNSQGWVYLSTTVYYEGWEEGSYMLASISDDRYTVLSSSNTWTNTSFSLYPDFEVILDFDDNQIHDPWELQLAEKFCPTLVLHHPTEWIAPEPVEYIGVSKTDLWFILYNINNGQYVEDYPLNAGYSFSPEMSTWHPWLYNPEVQKYSGLKGDSYMYEGKPPGKATGRYYLRFHFNYAGNYNSPSDWISYYETERSQNNFHHTIYAHLFIYNNKPVIQYWLFYPYNDGYNNHEGDWEHINVRISDANPNSASIESIDFYFHHKVKTLTSGYQLDSGHPIIYVGGSCADIDNGLSCQPGNTTGGSYPWSGTWYNIGISGYDEYVNGLGPTISHNNIMVKIIPNRDKINYDAHPELSWVNVPIRWGVMEADSPWDWIEPFAHPFPDGWIEPDVGNNAVLGPCYNDGWGRVGAAGDFENY